MTIVNNPARAAFVDLAKAVKDNDSRMAKLVAPLVKLDVAPDDLKGGGKYHADLKDAVAQAYLTPRNTRRSATQRWQRVSRGN
jgi:hypothetical protein